MFAYGSLIWNPGFEAEERQEAQLYGFHRRFCIFSHRYRGTSSQPGLVLGLDRGGACRGVIFRVAARNVSKVAEYLWAREMVTGVYRPSWVQPRTANGPVKALTFVADRAHAQYCGDRDPALMARMIVAGRGERGPNAEYLFNTVEHLRALGIRDRALEALARRVGDIMAKASVTPQAS